MDRAFTSNNRALTVGPPLLARERSVPLDAVRFHEGESSSDDLYCFISHEPVVCIIAKLPGRFGGTSIACGLTQKSQKDLRWRLGNKVK